MAIWPFGRKGKRPRSQMKASDTAERTLSSQDLEPVDRKPSRKRSKREKNHPRSTPPAESSSSQRAAPQTTQPLPCSRSRVDRPASFTETFDMGQENFTMAYAPPMLQKKRSSSSKGTLKKRLSKRSARDLAREQEIRALSSSLPDREYHTWDVRRGPSRHTDRHPSDHSLPIRDSARSSISEASDSYTFKVNALAVFAPRPVLRYSDAPKYHIPRSRNPSANSMRNDKRLFIDDEDVHSSERVAELADDLDAPALRELLERDRRRKEKKRLEEQERLQRRLQRRAERQREEERRQAGAEDVDPEELRGRDRTETSTTSTAHQAQPEQSPDGPQAGISTDQSGSWLRGPSRGSDTRSDRLSEVSAHVIGNIDDRSIRAGKSGQRLGTLSPSQSPVSQDYFSTNASQHPSVARESFSDLSRTGDSEKRMSDYSGRRMASWTSFFRRKRDSSERRGRPPSEFSTTSLESFSKSQSHPAAVAPATIPERTFIRTGTIHRTQSKFTEHLGDYPISPPDSRIQSPMPQNLEAVLDTSPHPDRTSEVLDEEPTTAVESELGRDSRAPSRPLSWEASSRCTGPDSAAFLSQSLASIDSEGSWMSGKYLRRISQAANNPVRRSATSARRRFGEYAESKGDTSEEYLSQLADEPQEPRDSVSGLRRASSTAMGAETGGDSDESPTSDSAGKEPNETWHAGLARQPTLVRPQVRPKSKEGMLDVEMMDASHGSDISPVEEEAVEIQRATSVDMGRGHGHARQISAGSARLLEIRSRTSFDSRRSEADQVSVDRS
ncbi:hypothetical protein VTN77DRAFT_2383 [Rasamsonia byssochlamydoides]|uniref:uncharacterized protein n=1 Tax=Rasamsonia byssochlamydoides TaxID=89139 RepID=UPI0037433FC8